MTPADTNRNATVWPLADLFDALRREGFQLRPDDYLEIVQVLDTFQPRSQADLQALMAPLIVASDEEQGKFDRIFERVLQQEGIKPHVVELEPPVPPKEIPWLWICAGLLMMLVFTYVAFLWPAPAFRSEIQMIAGSSGPVEVGDTLMFGVDSSLRQAAGPRARWQWETPTGKRYPGVNEPQLTVVAQRAGPLVVNLRSQRGLGLLFTQWTDSLRTVETLVCNKLPVVQIDTVSTRSASNTIRYQFNARIGQSSSTIQRTQWRIDGAVVAQNKSEWGQIFQAGTTPAYHDVRFEAIPDTSQPLCFGEANVSVGIQATNESSFTLDVQQTGNLIVPKTQLDRRYYWALWTLGVLLGLLTSYYVWMVIRDRQKKEPEAPLSPDSDNPLARFTSDEPPLEIPLENREAELITRDQPFYQLIRTLRQPTEGEIQRLHVARTMQATMREGGFPTLVFRPHLTETEYLFLIDRTQVRSQQVRLFDYLFRTFVQENVCVERFCFHKTFDLFTNEKWPKGLTLRQLSTTYGQHTLIIWGNGYPLLYPPYPVVEPAIREALIDWESRAILTPVPFDDWGSNERALQADFLLLPADLIGQLRLIQALSEKQTRQDTYLRQQTDELYSTEYIAFEEVDELSDYLGDDLLQWLAATAIYPRIRWEVVIEMGRELLPPEVVNFTNLLKLARISWMHEGNFPDYMRLELLKALRPENEAKARQTLLRMFAYAEQYFPGEHFYDGEKYLLQTVNQFSLYAHDPDTFADYQPAQQAFKQLYEKGLYPDGATLHYLENPNGQWSTLLPTATSVTPTKGIESAVSQPRYTNLQSYFDNLPVIEKPEPLPDEPSKRDPKRVYLPGIILLLVSILTGVWYLSSRPQNQIRDVNQAIPITIVLDTNRCVTALNTSVTDQPRWTVTLNDSLYSISNLRATRSFRLNNLTSGTSMDFDDKTGGASLRAIVAVNDTTGNQQSTSVLLTRDTLRMRITCPVASNTTNAGETTPRRLISVVYTNPNEPNFIRIQAFMSALAVDTAYQYTGPPKSVVYTGRSEVRYFRPVDEVAAKALATQASQALGMTIDTRLINEKRSLSTYLEVWINNGVASQTFTCQSVPVSWVNQFDYWETTNYKGFDFPGDWLINVRNKQVIIQDINSRELDIDSKDIDDELPKTTGIGMTRVGRIRSACRHKNLYLVQLIIDKSKSFESLKSGRVGLVGDELLIFRNVTRSSASIAFIELDAKQLNGPQGQAYLDKLVKSAQFRRYTPILTLKNKAVSENTPKAAVVTEPTNQIGNNPAIQQVPAQVNNYEQNANQTNLAVQSPVQSATERLRTEIENTKDETLQKGINAYRRGQYTEAITFYDQFLEKSPNSAYVLNLKGYSQFKLRQYEQAVTTLLAATKADPNYAWAYFDLARVYCAMGRSSEANQARERAISLRSDMRTIMLNDPEFMNLCGRGATAK